jgi:gas vesicle protein
MDSKKQQQIEEVVVEKTSLEKGGGEEVEVEYKEVRKRTVSGIKQTFTHMLAELEELEGRVKDDICDLRERSKDELFKIKAEVYDLREKSKDEIVQLHGNLVEDIKGLERKIEPLDNKAETFLKYLDRMFGELDGLKDGFRKARRELDFYKKFTEEDIPKMRIVFEDAKRTMDNLFKKVDEYKSVADSDLKNIRFAHDELRDALRAVSLKIDTADQMIERLKNKGGTFEMKMEAGLSELREEMKEKFSVAKGENKKAVENLSEEMKKGIQIVREDVKKEMVSVREENKKEVVAVSAAIKNVDSSLKGWFTQEIQPLIEKIGSITEMNEAIGSVMSEQDEQANLVLNLKKNIQEKANRMEDIEENIRSLQNLMTKMVKLLSKTVSHVRSSGEIAVADAGVKRAEDDLYRD